MISKLNITDLVRAIELDLVLVREHAEQEAEADSLSLAEVYDSVLCGEMIEHTPAKARCLPKCLIYGQTPSGRHIHSAWAYNDHKQLAILITVYDPSKNSWLWSDNYRKRRQL